MDLATNHFLRLPVWQRQFQVCCRIFSKSETEINVQTCHRQSKLLIMVLTGVVIFDRKQYSFRGNTDSPVHRKLAGGNCPVFSHCVMSFRRTFVLAARLMSINCQRHAENRLRGSMSYGRTAVSNTAALKNGCLEISQSPTSCSRLLRCDS